MKKNLLFSTRLIADKYIDADQLLNYITSDYIAKVDSAKLEDAIGTVCVIASAETDIDKRKANLRFGDGEIFIDIKTDNGASSVLIPATIQGEMPAEGFWYDPTKFSEAFRTVFGEVELHVSDKGFIIFKCPESQYMLSPMRAPVAKKESKPNKKAA